MAARQDRRVGAVTKAPVVRATLAYLSFGLLAGSLALVLRAEIPDSARDVVMVLIGAIISQSKEVFGFFFGTTQSSADKNQVIAGLTDGPRPADLPEPTFGKDDE